MDKDFVLGGIAILLVCVALITGLVLGVNAFDRSQQQKACIAFSQQSGRQTKFVEYTYWSRDCLTPSSDGSGTWISAYNLRDIGGN